ncbi:hypothetical protein [Actinomadura sp. KC06]|nr:hypothetical protein [Actinomadura sp. KC06]
MDKKGRRLFVDLSRDGRSTLAAAFGATADAGKRRVAVLPARPGDQR